MSPELRQVDAIFERLQKTRGAGSTAAKTALLRELFSGVTAEEQDFLARLLFGELRQGALEGVLVEAVARAARLPARDDQARGDDGRHARARRARGARRG